MALPMLRAWFTALLLACPLTALAQNAPQAPAPLAHSALVAVDVAAEPGGLVLRVRRTTGGQPLAVSGVAVSIDGRSEPATARADGSWFAPRPAGARDAGAAVEVTVAHDGIHEVLSGRLAGAPAAAPAVAPAGAGGGRSQMAWWVLNIVIVLIAAIAISRRMS